MYLLVSVVQSHLFGAYRDNFHVPHMIHIPKALMRTYKRHIYAIMYVGI